MIRELASGEQGRAVAAATPQMRSEHALVRLKDQDPQPRSIAATAKINTDLSRR
jgi:hypothetical protein